MKSEKLKLLLNKVVNVNIPNGVYCRGFLTYNSQLECYSVKVIDVTSGNANVGSNITISDIEAEYVTHAEKPKLMGVKRTSLHYRLVKYVFRSSAPTPKTMQNGCPYFWLLLFSIFVVIPLMVFRAIWYMLSFIPKIFDAFLGGLADNWVNSLDDENAYELDRYAKRNQRPLATRLYLRNKSEHYLMQRYVKQKYNLDCYHPDYGKTVEQIKDKWKKWSEEVEREHAKRQDLAYRARTLQELKRDEAKAKWEARTQPITDGIEKIFESIENAWNNIKSLKTLIRRTKQVIGTIITLSALVISYFVAQILTITITWIVQMGVNYWIYLVYGLIGLTALGILILIVIFVGNWLQKIVNQYRQGKKIWYVEPFVWIIWYPVRFIVLGILYGLLYVIYKPLEFLFYTFLLKLVIINLGLLIWGFLKGLWGLFLGSTGIFGEYFSASYSDYCPGIEWIGFDEDSK